MDQALNDANTHDAMPNVARRRKKLEDPRRLAIETALMRGCGDVFERASWDACRRAGAWMGLLLFGALKHRRHIAIANVQRAFPQLHERSARRIARRASQNFAMTFCEFLHLRGASPESLRQYSWIDGLEHIEAGFERGCGVLLLTAHLGNWEIMGARAAQEFPLTVIARPTSNGGVQAHIDAVRRAGGIAVISRFDTGRAPLQVLKRNEALGILPDQHAGRDGLLLPFFNHPTRMVPALARLAMLSGALVVPSFGVRREPWLKDGRIVARVSPGMIFELGRRDERELQVETHTRRVIEQLEIIVRRHPDQWLWAHRRWREGDEERQN